MSALWMLAGAFSFATMAALSRELATGTDWRLLALVRAGLMLVFSLMWALGTRARLVFLAPPMLWMRSIVGSLGMLFTFYALTHLPISEAVTLLNIYPIWVALLAWGLGSRPSAGSWTAIAVGLAGVFLVAQPEFGSSRLALGMAIASSLCTSLVLHGLSRLGPQGTWAVIVHFGIISTLTCGVAFVCSGVPGSLQIDTPSRLALVLGVGLTGTLGQFALTRAFAEGDPSKVSVVGLTQLVFGAGYDALLFGRRHSLMTLAGMLLVAAPTAWLLIRSRRPASPGEPAAAAPSQPP